MSSRDVATAVKRPCPPGCPCCTKRPSMAALVRHLELCDRCCDVIARGAHPDGLCSDGRSLIERAAAVEGTDA